MPVVMREERNKNMHPGAIGGIIGGICGLAGGIVGTYCSIKNTNGPRERTFMIKAIVIGWISILVFLGLMFALPNPYRHCGADAWSEMGVGSRVCRGSVLFPKLASSDVEPLALPTREPA